MDLEPIGLRKGNVLLAPEGVGIYERDCERWTEDKVDDDNVLTIRRDGETYVFNVPSVVLVP